MSLLDIFICYYFFIQFFACIISGRWILFGLSLVKEDVHFTGKVRSSDNYRATHTMHTISMNVQIVSLFVSANPETSESFVDNTMVFDIPVKAILNMMLTGSVKFLQC